MVWRSVIITLTLAVAALASAQKALDVAQGLAQAEAKAVLTNDKGWYQRTLAPEYVGTGSRGDRKTKAESIASMDMERKTARPTKVTAKAVQATIKGDRMATTTNVDIMAALEAGDGKPHSIEYHATMLATWVKRKGAWLKLTERPTKEHGKIDGKAF